MYDQTRRAGCMADNHIFQYKLNVIHEEMVTPYSIAQGTGPTTLRVRGKGFWPFHRVLLNGKELDTKFVNRSELQATVPADLVKDVGMYKVTVKSRGETVAESNPAPLVVGYKH